MKAHYQGQIKQTNLIKDDNSSYYWLISVPIHFGKANQHSQNMEFLFDSGVGGSILLNETAFDKISKICKRVVKDSVETNVINIFGIDVPFYKAKNPKYDKINILGLNALQLTKSAIVKDFGQQKKFRWVLNFNMNQVLPKKIYEQTFHPLKQGQTKFRDISVKFSNTKVQKRTIIFDTGFGIDVGKNQSLYIVKDKDLLNVSQSARIVFKEECQLLFRLEYTQHFKDDIVGPNKFLAYQIVFVGRNENQLYWAIADK